MAGRYPFNDFQPNLASPFYLPNRQQQLDHVDDQPLDFSMKRKSNSRSEDFKYDDRIHSMTERMNPRNRCIRPKDEPLERLSPTLSTRSPIHSLEEPMPSSSIPSPFHYQPHNLSVNTPYHLQQPSTSSDIPPATIPSSSDNQNANYNTLQIIEALLKAQSGQSTVPSRNSPSPVGVALSPRLGDQDNYQHVLEEPLRSTFPPSNFDSGAHLGRMLQRRPEPIPTANSNANHLQAYYQQFSENNPLLHTLGMPPLNVPGSHGPSPTPLLDMDVENSLEFLRFREEMLKKINTTKPRRAHRTPRNSESGSGMEDIEENSERNAEGFAEERISNERLGQDGDKESQAALNGDNPSVANDRDEKKTQNRGRQRNTNTVKDQAYWERRRRNNEAAKKSRDLRRRKEIETGVRAAFLERKYRSLKLEVSAMRASTTFKPMVF